MLKYRNWIQSGQNALFQTAGQFNLYLLLLRVICFIFLELSDVFFWRVVPYLIRRLSDISLKALWFLGGMSYWQKHNIYRFEHAPSHYSLSVYKSQNRFWFSLIHALRRTKSLERSEKCFTRSAGNRWMHSNTGLPPISTFQSFWKM